MIPAHIEADPAPCPAPARRTVVGKPLRVSHTGNPRSWTGLIKRGKEVVWRCPHRHHNRDYDTDTNTSARMCAEAVLSALQDPDKTKSAIQSLSNWNAPCLSASQVRGLQWSIKRHKWALEVADELRKAVPA